MSHLVKHYWSIENCIPNGEGHVQRIVPNGLIEMYFYFGPIPEPLGTDISINENTVVTGQLDKYYDIRVRQNLSLFSIVFQPLGLVSLLDVPVSEFFNQNVPLRYLLRDVAIELESRLYEARTFIERARIAEQFLFQRLQKACAKYHFQRIGHCITLINKAKGAISIGHLASEACFSRKQFERVFLQYIGTSPKRFIKVVRFQNAIYEKCLGKSNKLTSLAYKCGYYDQSHMTNDFIKLSGMTPKQYFNECEPYSDYFQ